MASSIDPNAPFFFSNNGKTVCIDPVYGSGATPDTANIAYKGFVVFMPPQKFLSLCHKLQTPRPSSKFFQEVLPLLEHCIGPPCLYLLEDGSNGEYWRVMGHEGRHRVLAMQAIGMELVPVYVFPGQLRARHVKGILKDLVAVQGEDKNWVIDAFSGAKIVEGKLMGSFREIEIVPVETLQQITGDGSKEQYRRYWSKPKKNPLHRRTKRRNSDDRLRRLERKARDGTPSEIADYWRACIKAGITPPPNFIWNPDRVVWTLYPVGYPHYDDDDNRGWRRVVKEGNQVTLISNVEDKTTHTWEYFPTVNEALLALLEMP